MRWLIVEDALRNRKGHWYEYISTFDRCLKALGDEVVVLADHQAEPFIREKLQVRPVLPDSIWHRMSDGAGALKRYGRVPLHAWKTWSSLRRFLRGNPSWDVIFVPTVLVHHLLGWYGLIHWVLPCGTSQVLLFFPNLPIHLREDGTSMWNSSPTTRLMRALLWGLASRVHSGVVILGVETLEMRDAFANLTGLPVTYFPHPVAPLDEAVPSTDAESITMACYGPARPEKGSELLQDAMIDYLEENPTDAIRFVFQWMEDFQDESGNCVRLSPRLEADPRVEVIRGFFAEGDYARHLLRTDVMLLPYRRASYGLRVSRVVIEAMVNGIPVVTSRSTTLDSQATAWGASLSCEEGSAESLKQAIGIAEGGYAGLKARAREIMPRAIAHFSVRNFRDLLLANKIDIDKIKSNKP